VNRAALDKVWRLASPHHRKFGLHPLDIVGLAFRVAAIALLSGVIWIHLNLWSEGYKHIPTIGPLFLLGAISTIAFSAVLFLWPSRLLGFLALATDLGVLVSLIVSINIGLFGFKESLHASFVVEAIVIEALAAAALIGWVVIDYAAESHEGRSTSLTSLELPNPVQEESWSRRAREAEVDAGDLARALEFHIVNECDCHGATDIATLRRHEVRVVSLRSDQHGLDATG